MLQLASEEKVKQQRLIGDLRDQFIEPERQVHKLKEEMVRKEVILLQEKETAVSALEKKHSGKIPPFSSLCLFLFLLVLVIPLAVMVLLPPPLPLLLSSYLFLRQNTWYILHSLDVLKDVGEHYRQSIESLMIQLQTQSDDFHSLLMWLLNEERKLDRKSLASAEVSGVLKAGFMMKKGKVVKGLVVFLLILLLLLYFSTSLLLSFFLCVLGTHSPLSLLFLSAGANVSSY
jgi:hypothetical protein